MKNNADLQADVQNAIKWEPLLHAAQIGVTAKDGVVSLTGIVDSYAKKMEAESAAKKVSGVKALVENIEVKFSGSWNKSDSEIAHDVVNGLNTNWSIPKDKIGVKVENGWVNLDGEVAWNYQKQASYDAVKNLFGVKGVSNLIKVKSDNKDVLEKKSVENALARNWSINANDVKVEVKNNNVKLTGLVHSLYQKEEATRLAWNARGVCAVDNELAVIN